MLTLEFKNGGTLYDESTGEFIELKPQTIKLEHSLIALAKWEAKHHKPFLNDKYDPTEEELIDYFRCMTITPNVPPELYYTITPEMFKKLQDYIQDSMTATTFGDRSLNKNAKQARGETPTAEIIYYWMISYNIPIEFEKWHLNRLLTLIRVFNVKNQDSESSKMSKKDTIEYQRMLNEQRRKMKG